MRANGVLFIEKTLYEQCVRRRDGDMDATAAVWGATAAT